jgi:hypothetical protein
MNRKELFAEAYDPFAAGSIDGMSDVLHDKGLERALLAHCM